MLYAFLPPLLHRLFNRMAIWFFFFTLRLSVRLSYSFTLHGRAIAHDRIRFQIGYHVLFRCVQITNLISPLFQLSYIPSTRYIRSTVTILEDYSYRRLEKANQPCIIPSASLLHFQTLSSAKPSISHLWIFFVWKHYNIDDLHSSHTSNKQIPRLIPALPD